MARRFGIDPEVLRKHGVKVKSGPSPITDDEMEEARKIALAPKEKRNRHRMCVTLDPLTVSLARKIANGNISRGIDRAVLHFSECDRPVRTKTRARDVRTMK